MSEQREGYQFVGWYIDKECTKRLNPGGVLPHSVTLYDKFNHLNTVNSFHKLIEEKLQKYKGVASKYIKVIRN